MSLIRSLTQHVFMVCEEATLPVPSFWLFRARAIAYQTWHSDSATTLVQFHVVRKRHEALSGFIFQFNADEL